MIRVYLHPSADQPRGLVVRVSDYYHEVQGSIPGSTVVIFPVGKDSRGDHGLGSLVEFRFKGPSATTSPLTTSGKRNCASLASHPQMSVTLLPCPGGRTTKSRRTCGGIGRRQQQQQNSADFPTNVKGNLQTTRMTFNLK